MGRVHRTDVGDCVYHVINRANGRAKIFNTPQDYQEFEILLQEIKETFDMRILGYTVMPNHWHLLLHPKKDKDLSKSLHWLTTTHSKRHHARKKTVGYGHVYQGRYKSFHIQVDRHLLSVLKYIERNPVRAGLCKNAEDWRWGSARHRIKSTKNQKLISKLPIHLPRDYRGWVAVPEPAEELKAIRMSIEKGIPYGKA
jgi:putative transposase